MQTFFIKEGNEKSNNNIMFLPLNKKSHIPKRKRKKIIKKLKEKNVKMVILSKSLYGIYDFKEELLNNKIKYLDGRFVFKMLINEILEYICRISKINVAKLKISIIINNNLNTINSQIILDLAQQVKSLNIVTNNLKTFKQMEEYLYNEMGIIINLSHNIDKTSCIIINFEDEIKKYNIPNKCIIINVNHSIIISSAFKNFNGININNFNIIMPKKYRIKGFEDKLIYEKIIQNINYDDIRKQIKKDKIKIKNLIGEKGIIDDKEFYNFFLTKS